MEVADVGLDNKIGSGCRNFCINGSIGQRDRDRRDEVGVVGGRSSSGLWRLD